MVGGLGQIKLGTIQLVPLALISLYTNGPPGKSNVMLAVCSSNSVYQNTNLQLLACLNNIHWGRRDFTRLCVRTVRTHQCILYLLHMLGTGLQPTRCLGTGH